jgi:DNA (cytosine-5)-methyltransferase 1
VFHKVEVDSMEYNLKLIDSNMPIIVSSMLLNFFVNRHASIKNNLMDIDKKGLLNNEINYGDYSALTIKVKRLLSSILLGFFPGTKWNGKNIANGTIIVKNDGQQVAFHIIDLPALEDYLFENIKFDTPSTTRHRFGKVILERDGCVYFKLNLQLRF